MNPPSATNTHPRISHLINIKSYAPSFSILSVVLFYTVIWRNFSDMHACLKMNMRQSTSTQLSSDCYHSVYSTVLRNTVVKATIKVNGKHQILGILSSETLDRSTWNLTWVIKSAVWPHTPKIVKIGPAGPPRHMGEISCSNVFLPFLYFFCWLLAQPWRTHFWEYCHRFCAKRRGSVRIDFLGGSQLQHQNFSPPKPQKNLNFMDLENFWAKRWIMGRFISKLPIIVTAAPWKLQSE